MHAAQVLRGMVCIDNATALIGQKTVAEFLFSATAKARKVRIETRHPRLSTNQRLPECLLDQSAHYYFSEEIWG